MVRHVVLLSWNEKFDDEAVEAVTRGFADLPAQIPEIRAYTFGPDLQTDRRNSDYVLVADFDNEEDFQTYSNHPAHIDFMKRLTIPILSSFKTAQFALS